ncbi:MAG: hypothetical protein LAN59_12850 [Acidobacteriia bacterium]|nr:hypothetical protein [Terriglobia bacterium]
MDVVRMLLMLWGAVTVVLIVALIYRSTLATREEDQIFLDPAEDSMANEQRAIVAKIEKLSRPIMALWVLSGGLLAVIAGVWVWRGFQNF